MNWLWMKKTICFFRRHHHMELQAYVVRGFGISTHNICKTCGFIAW